MMPASAQDPDALGANVLTIALIGPDQQRRGAVRGSQRLHAGRHWQAHGHVRARFGRNELVELLDHVAGCEMEAAIWAW